MVKNHLAGVRAGSPSATIFGSIGRTTTEIMPAILPAINIDAPDKKLSRYFLPYQIRWIQDHSRMCLAEKSVRIGWTYADALKNVRKRILNKKRDYLFATKDQASAVEYMRTVLDHAELLNYTRYIDKKEAPRLRLAGLFTCRTDDWNFLQTVLWTLLRNLPALRGAGDETGMGRQICWETAKQFPGQFTSVNFASQKHDLGFALMNQLSVAEKIFPKNQPDVAQDFFALRKIHSGQRWKFTEGRNLLNPASHCDIAWAGGLATQADRHYVNPPFMFFHTETRRDRVIAEWRNPTIIG